MIPFLTIGDFSRATHLTIKTLRHYHQVGLLEPAGVDPSTGYRQYRVDQIPTAQVIRRFRDLDMPLRTIQRILAAPDPATRNELIAGHLHRLEGELGRTRRAVTSLRGLLEKQPADGASVIEMRAYEAAPALGIAEVVDAADSVAWLQGALGELHGVLAAHGMSADGPAGGIYSTEFFNDHRGPTTVFVPCVDPVRATGRVSTIVIPAAELAVITHSGPPAEVDRAYGDLAAYVAQHALGFDGPIREHYLVGPRDTPDQDQWRTEIGWPVFQTGANSAEATA